MPITTSTPRDSATLSAQLLEQIRQVREEYRVDDYEEVLRTIRDAAAK